MNNSQQMLQALEEQDLTKAEYYFVKALEMIQVTFCMSWQLI